MAIDKDGLPDIRSVQQDLFTPLMTEGDPAPGRRVRQVIAAYRDTHVYHTLYLPTDWESARDHYPVLIEYAGNGPYSNVYGDTCTGRVEDCNLGYGLSAGLGMIWACLPYVSDDRKHNQLQWWGDVEATVGYCKAAVAGICRNYGGDPSAVLIAGFSRGAIACNFIGLHDDEIASVWKAFIAHSHYDGVRPWPYPGSDRRSAARRLARLQGRAQFISHEGSVQETQAYLQEVATRGAFAFQALPYRNHTDAWVLRDIPERQAVRDWIDNTLSLAQREEPGWTGFRGVTGC
jgi:hypothetical protein